MTVPIRDLHRTELPHVLVLATATTCGVLAAMATQIVLAQRGIEVASIWRDLFSARGAGAWWIIVACAFAAGAAVGGMISRIPLPWLRFRLLRWIAGAALVFGLAHIGHAAALKSGGTVGIHVAGSLAALCAAALMALFGAYFAAKR